MLNVEYQKFSNTPKNNWVQEMKAPSFILSKETKNCYMNTVKVEIFPKKNDILT